MIGIVLQLKVNGAMWVTWTQLCVLPCGKFREEACLHYSTSKYNNLQSSGNHVHIGRQEQRIWPFSGSCSSAEIQLCREPGGWSAPLQSWYWADGELSFLLAIQLSPTIGSYLSLHLNPLSDPWFPFSSHPWSVPCCPPLPFAHSAWLLLLSCFTCPQWLMSSPTEMGSQYLISLLPRNYISILWGSLPKSCFSHSKLRAITSW